MSIYDDFLSTKIFGASIEFGIGIVSKLPEYMKQLKANKPLIVTDKVLIKNY